MINRKPEGYKELLAYQKAAELQEETLKLVALFPKTKTMVDLADQMARSGRSGTKNIIEGWKRNTTKEYFQFLGFSIGAIEELKDDAADIAKGLYRELMGIKGIMGEKGEKGSEEKGEEKGEGGDEEKKERRGEEKDERGAEEKGEMERGRKEEIVREEKGEKGFPIALFKPITSTSTPIPPLQPFKPLFPLQPFKPPAPIAPLQSLRSFKPLAPIAPLQPFSESELMALRFFPVDLSLSPVVRLYLRAKETQMLLYKLQKSLDLKMEREMTKPQEQKIRENLKREERAEINIQKMGEDLDLVKLNDGRYVKKFKN